MPTAIATTALRAKAVKFVMLDETTAGTLSSAPSGTDGATEQTFQTIEPPVFTVESASTDFSETGADLINMQRAFDTYNYGVSNFSFLAKPHASAGTEPVDQYILKKFFGYGAVNGSTWEFYFTDQVNTFSSWMLYNSETLAAASGCIVKSLSLSIEKAGNLAYNAEVWANQVQYATQATVASVSGNDITINAPSLGGDGTNVTFANAPVEVFNNSDGASRGTTTVSSIASNVITVASTPASTDADDILRPTLSTAALDTTEPVSMRQTALYMAADGTSGASLFTSANKIEILSAELTIDRDLKTPAQAELTGNDYPPATYSIGEVNIEGSATLLARPNDFQRFKLFEDDLTYAIGIEVQDDDQIIWVEMQYCQVEVPTLSEADGTLNQDFAFKVVKGTATDDENRFKIIYK